MSSAMSVALEVCVSVAPAFAANSRPRCSPDLANR